jgi:hypothetical protein
MRSDIGFPQKGTGDSRPPEPLAPAKDFIKGVMANRVSWASSREAIVNTAPRRKETV